LPPHTSQSSAMPAGLAAFLAEALLAVGVEGPAAIIDPAKDVTNDTLRMMQLYRMFRLDAAAGVLFRNRGVVLMGSVIL
jgi:hypothetical protein